MSWIDTGLDFLDDFAGPLLSTGTILATSIIKSNAAEDAAEALAQGTYSSIGLTNEATREAIELSRQQYEQFRTDISPWREEGVKGLTDLEEKVMAGPGEFVKPPGYEEGLKEGVEGIQRRQSARGMLASGQTLKGLSEFGQEYGSREYNKFLDRYYEGLRPLQELAGVGQTATAEIGQAGGSSVGSAGALTDKAAAISGAGYENIADIQQQTDIMKKGIRTKALTDIGGDIAYALGGHVAPNTGTSIDRTAY